MQTTRETLGAVGRKINERFRCETMNRAKENPPGADGSANSFVANYAGEVPSRIIFKQDNFCVIPSLGQLVPGYLLLVPTRHYRAFGDMPVEELLSAEALKTSVAERMRSLYGNVVFFEHGVRTPDSGGCGISHAHLHLVPFPQEKEPIGELINEFPFERLSSLVDLACARPDHSYLYYESVDGSKYVFYPPFIPSQYMRRVLADAIGNKAWDWRQCGREESLLNTFIQMSDSLMIARR
jgi:diadenosine tetraphosphate (Ap4A) HIT family hydrolase